VLLSCFGAFVAAISNVPSYTLHNAAVPGTQMPMIGLGVGAYGQLSGVDGEYWDDQVAEVAVSQFLKLGGRRLDTSLKYYNDIVGVGLGLANSGVPREEVFITCKVDDPYGYDTTLEHFAEILTSLNTTYVDLVLIHWPGPIAFNFSSGGVNTCEVNQTCSFGPGCRQDTWRALELIFTQGHAHAIGVSNFEQRHLADIFETATMLPAVNQFEFHPYWQPLELLQYCQSLNITVMSYSPLGAPDFMAWHTDKWPIALLDQPVLAILGKKYNKTPAQILIRWHLQHNIALHPRTNKPEHMAENLDVFDFLLNSNEMNAISAIQRPLRSKVCPDPLTVP